MTPDALSDFFLASAGVAGALTGGPSVGLGQEIGARLRRDDDADRPSSSKLGAPRPGQAGGAD